MNNVSGLPVFGLELPTMKFAMDSQAEKDKNLDELAMSVVILRAFHHTLPEARTLISRYKEFEEEGTTNREARMLLEDITAFRLENPKLVKLTELPRPNGRNGGESNV